MSLLLPAALKMFPWLPHQVSLMGVKSCQRSVSHHGDFCLEPGPDVDSWFDAHRGGLPHHREDRRGDFRAIRAEQGSMGTLWRDRRRGRDVAG